MAVSEGWRNKLNDEFYYRSGLGSCAPSKRRYTRSTPQDAGSVTALEIPERYAMGYVRRHALSSCQPVRTGLRTAPYRLRPDNHRSGPRSCPDRSPRDSTGGGAYRHEYRWIRPDA